MVDANQRWDVDEAIAWMKQLTDFGLLWIEEPTSPDDVLGHARIAQALKPYGIGVATGEQCQNRVLFKQYLQAQGLQFLQIDSCRLGGVNEILSIILMAHKFGVPVCPHAGGVGLCEYVQHLSMWDYVSVSGSTDNRMIEYVRHLSEHYTYPASATRGRYVAPKHPGYGCEMKAASIQYYEFPNGTYFTRNFNYFTKLGIKGPRPYFFVGTLWGNFLQPNPVLELQRYQKYGKIYGIFEGNKAIVQVGDPDLIKQILVTDFHVFAGRRGIGNVRHPIMDLTLVAAKGDDWRRIRWIVSPTFTPGKMKRMYPLVRQSLATFLDTLDTYAVDKQEINAKDMYGCYAMDVIANCAFATKTNSLKDPNNAFLINARKVFSPPVWRVLIGFLLPTNALNFLNIRTLFEEKSLDFFSQTMREIIKNRKKSETKFNDFVELLMKAKERNDENRDESDGHEDHYINEEDNNKKKVLDNNLTSIKCLTEDEVLAQGFSFFAAGFETTSSTLAFCSYELALNPDVQQKLYEEVMASVDTNGEIDYEVLTKLPFLDAVITETLRLHSTALKLTRKAAEDYRLGDTGITIPKGDIVEIPIHAIHHS
ncbi:unnamed protein product, partial [Medioppia subpectinata]